MTPTLLDDVHSVWGEGEVRLPSATLLARLRDLNPTLYGRWTTSAFGQAMRSVGAPTKDICHRVTPDSPWKTVKGVTRSVLLAAEPQPAAERDFADLRQAGPVVYFAERQGFVKIGTTTNLAARVGALNRGDSAIAGMTILAVDVLATMPGGRQVEQSIHKLFQDLRFEGEWFLFEAPLTDFVAAIVAASKTS